MSMFVALDSFGKETECKLVIFSRFRPSKNSRSVQIISVISDPKNLMVPVRLVTPDITRLPTYSVETFREPITVVQS